MTRNKYGNTEEEYRQAVVSSTTIAEACRLLGIKPVGSNYHTLKKKISELELDTSHFVGQAHALGKRHTYSPKTNETRKRHLIQDRGHSCETCFNTSWNNLPITLELEHVDGDVNNNETTNLKLLCPNCHSQTPTWRRRKSALKTTEQ